MSDKYRDEERGSKTKEIQERRDEKGVAKEGRKRRFRLHRMAF